MSKTVYQHDLAGFFVGETEADQSPLEPGVYLMPARTTEVPPPADVPDDKWPRWNGREWALVNRPTSARPLDPVEKLREFLTANPDVMAILQQGGV